MQQVQRMQHEAWAEYWQNGIGWVVTDVVTAGAAADSADDADERLSGLPRILRYLLLVNDRAASIELRHVGEHDGIADHERLRLADILRR